jgi:hypothetical protein
MKNAYRRHPTPADREFAKIAAVGILCGHPVTIALMGQKLKALGYTRNENETLLAFYGRVYQVPPETALLYLTQLAAGKSLEDSNAIARRAYSVLCELPPKEKADAETSNAVQS